MATVFSKSDIDEIILSIRMSNACDEHINKVESRLLRFAEAVSYQLDYDRINIYINKLRREYAPETFRKHVIDIRRLLKKLNDPLANQIKLPKVPKQRKIVIKKEHMQKLLQLIDENVKHKRQRLRLKAAILLMATSGLRPEELCRLTLEDIDIENRTIYVRAEVSKTGEERVTFFNEEAKQALIEYLETNPPNLFKYQALRAGFDKIKDKTKLRMKHMRKFFIQEWERCGGSLVIRKMLAGGSTEDNEQVDPKRLLTGHSTVEIEIEHYNFQDVEDLRKIYDAVGIRVFD